ncbi:MAG: hypothetical protein AAGN35_04240 [Bacteroidota bacterium]
MYKLSQIRQNIVKNSLKTLEPEAIPPLIVQIAPGKTKLLHPLTPTTQDPVGAIKPAFSENDNSHPPQK